MNGTLMSTTQMLRSISQLLNYSRSMHESECGSTKSSLTTAMSDERSIDEQLPSTSAADSQTASSLSKYLRAGELKGEAAQPNNSGSYHPFRRRLKRERVHPVSAYFLVTDETSQCAICILCFNAMKASKTANLMRHMSRYHKLVAADLERQWDQIKGAKMRCRVRDEVTVASPSFTSEVPPASPIIEFPDNGSPFLGLESNVADGMLSIVGGEQKGISRVEDVAETSRCVAVMAEGVTPLKSTPCIAEGTANVSIGDATEGVACENFEAQIPEVNTRIAHGEEAADPCTATAMLTSCPSCSRKTADTALLVTLLKRQDQLHKKTERLLEEHIEREKLFQEKQEEFWKRADAFMRTQKEQQRTLCDVTTKLTAILQHISSQQST
uniref:BED-type domain-containing protein n=1 Tax=Parascaris univalens TaxID=6257 RepID=A0A915C5B0_PARUN